MLETLLSYLAPHHCCGCDKIGNLLCDNCKYDIINESNIVCVVCKKPCFNNWLCKNCEVPYDKAWIVGERSGMLQRLVGLYKFERAVEAHKQLAELLDAILPVLPENTIIVPVPTTQSRIRERGYDHMLLIAKRLARLRKLECQQLIKRKSYTKQRHSNAKLRQAQAKQAFYVDKISSTDSPYLIVDDVMTTGATARYAAKALKGAGVKHVWVAIIARQTLD